jgi:hypothetical protein
VPRFDPAASLRVWAIEVTVGGCLLRVPPLPAADWLPSVMTTNPMAVLELVEDFDLAEVLLDGDLTVDQLREALIEVVEAASGRPAVAAFAIAGIAAQRWDVIGADLARVGLRFTEISLGAALDAIYGSVSRHMDEKALAEFNRLLDAQTKPVESSPRRAPRGAKPLPATAEQYVRERPKTVLRRPQDRQAAQSAPPTGQLQQPSGSDPPARSAPIPPGADGRNLPGA